MEETGDGDENLTSNSAFVVEKLEGQSMYLFIYVCIGYKVLLLVSSYRHCFIETLKQNITT